MGKVVMNHDLNYEAWMRQRSGHLTGSVFHKVFFSRDMKSDSARDLATRIAFENIFGCPLEEDKGKVPESCQWGITNESIAISEYEHKFGEIVSTPGFIECEEIGEMRVGCSPDGLIGDKGIVEVKCSFNRTKHIRSCIGETKREWLAQVHFYMTMLDREYCDLVYFDPRHESSSPFRLFVRREYFNKDLSLKILDKTRIFAKLVLEEKEKISELII